MDWQRHLLVYHWQLFLPNWQTGDESCLLGFVWGVWPGGMLRALQPNNLADEGHHC